MGHVSLGQRLSMSIPFTYWAKHCHVQIMDESSTRPTRIMDASQLNQTNAVDVTNQIR